MTAIPSISDFTDSATTEGEFKTALSGLHDYLTGLLGTAGTPPAAQAALGALLGAGVATRTTAYTVVDADRGKIIACTGSFALNLTAAATLGAGFAIAVANVGSGTITVDPAGTETIDGAASYALPGNTTILIACTGSGWLIVGASPLPPVTNPYAGNKAQVFTSSGTFTVPDGVTAVKVTVIGGGGGGGGNFAGHDVAAKSGAGGGQAIKWVSDLTPGSNVSVTIGAGGGGGASGAGGAPTNGGSGGASSFGSHCSATGGGGGSASSYYGTPSSTPGNGVGGFINYVGIGVNAGGQISGMSPNYGNGGSAGIGNNGGSPGTAGFVIVEY